MRLVSIGDLVLDYYYKDNKFLGVNGGMTSHNIIANLSKMGFATCVFGICGNDIQGELAIKSLDVLNVDVGNVKKLDNVRTRCFHVSYYQEDNKLSFTSKKRCPNCNSKHWYDTSLIDPDFVINNLKEDDILIFDNLNNINQQIIDNTGNKKIIDLGQYFEFESLTNNEIISKIQNKFEYINFNERVSNYLIKKLSLKNDLELFNILNPTLMTITRGNKGATFIYNSKLYNFKLESSTEVVDSTGAGDAFVSCIIKSYLKSNLDFEKWYSDSVKLTSKVVTKMGARGHINSLFKVKPFENSCLCDTFLYKERKKIKRCNININNLETRIINAIPVYKRLDEIGFCENDNYLFVGTGGSYADAVFSSKIINDLYGANTYSLYPRDVIYRNNKKINKIILFSYSGTTNDILNSIKGLEDNDIYLITKGEPSKISAQTNISKDNIISYRTSTNKGKEKGFLSFEGATSPASIFLKYYYSKIDKDFNVENFIRKSFNYWKNNIDKLVSNKFVNNLAKIKQVNIFSGDYTSSACYDLESKFIESGVTNCIIHEKKNFSHGRFINYENLNNNLSIYFKQKETDKYETELLNYLDKDNTIIIESNYNLMLAEFDLLIASQYIIYYIGKVLDIDVSKPNYSEKALKLYFYKGKL